MRLIIRDESGGELCSWSGYNAGVIPRIGEEIERDGKWAVVAVTHNFTMSEYICEAKVRRVEQEAQEPKPDITYPIKDTIEPIKSEVAEFTTIDFGEMRISAFKWVTQSPSGITIIENATLEVAATVDGKHVHLRGIAPNIFFQKVKP